MVHLLELLERDVLEGEGASLHDAADIIFLDIEGEDLYELQNFHVEVVVVHLEMPRTDVDASALGISIEREELLKNEEPIAR